MLYIELHVKTPFFFFKPRLKCLKFLNGAPLSRPTEYFFLVAQPLYTDERFSELIFIIHDRTWISENKGNEESFVQTPQGISISLRLNSSSRQEFAVEANLAPTSRKNCVRDITSFCLENCDKISQSVNADDIPDVDKIVFLKIECVYRFLLSRKQSRLLEKSNIDFLNLLRNLQNSPSLGQRHLVFGSCENKIKSITKSGTSHLLPFST